MLLRAIAGRPVAACALAAAALLAAGAGCAPSPDGARETEQRGAAEEGSAPPGGADRAASRPAAPPAASTAAARSFPILDRLGWLAGSWVGERDGRRFEEHWLPAAGGMMLGVHREVGPGGLGSFEYVRIQGLPAGAVYFASPGGVSPTRFDLAESDVGRVVFENPEHDFPQRITYWLEGEELRARIDGYVQGLLEHREWVFRRSERGIRALAPGPDEEGDR